MMPMNNKGRRIVLGHIHDVRQTASLLAADPLSVFRIVDALDPPSREVDFDQLAAAAFKAQSSRRSGNEALR